MNIKALGFLQCLTSKTEQSRNFVANFSVKTDFETSTRNTFQKFSAQPV